MYVEICYYREFHAKRDFYLHIHGGEGGGVSIVLHIFDGYLTNMVFLVNIYLQALSHFQEAEKSKSSLSLFL